MLVTLLTTLLMLPAHAWDSEACGGYKFTCDANQGVFKIEDATSQIDCQIAHTAYKTPKLLEDYTKQNIYLSSKYHYNEPQVAYVTKMWPDHIFTRGFDTHTCSFNGHKMDIRVTGLATYNACSRFVDGTHMVEAWLDGKQVASQVTFQQLCDQFDTNLTAKIDWLAGKVMPDGKINFSWASHYRKGDATITPGDAPLTNKNVYKADYNSSLEQ